MRLAGAVLFILGAMLVIWAWAIGVIAVSSRGADTARGLAILMSAPERIFIVTTGGMMALSGCVFLAVGGLAAQLRKGHAAAMASLEEMRRSLALSARALQAMSAQESGAAKSATAPNQALAVRQALIADADDRIPVHRER